MTVTIVADTLAGLEHFFETMPDRTTAAASKAINRVANRSALKAIKDDIYSQVAFPKGYLDLPARLAVTKLSTAQDLEAIISARSRATSLARFLTPGQSPATARTSGVTIQVKPGHIATFKNGFLVRLRSGANTETLNNLGLAVRLKPGESLHGGKGVELDRSKNGSSVWLLYGPSVDQVFRTVADDVSDMISDDVTEEFNRQFSLDNNF